MNTFATRLFRVFSRRQAGPDIVLFFREGLILQIVIPEEPDR